MAFGTESVQFLMSISQGAGRVNRLFPQWRCTIFSSNRKGGFGGLDLYKSKRQADGTWSLPENLGPTINTAKNEKSPFIHPDSESLYFASDGHPGMGGYDLFKSTDDGPEWDKPQNLGYPINTEKDEIGLMVTLDGKQAYFASNKINKANGWDIYFFNLYEAVQPEEVVLVKGTLTKDMFASDDEAKVILKNSTTGETTTLQVDEESGAFAAVVKKEEADVCDQIRCKEGCVQRCTIALGTGFIRSSRRRESYGD